MTTAPPTWPAPELPERPQGAAPPAPTGADAWPAWAAPAALVAGFIAANIGGVVIFLIAAVFGADVDADDLSPGLVLGATFVQDIAFIGAAVFFARMSGRVSAADFGLRRAPLWRSAGLVVAIYIGFAIVTAIWSEIVDAPDSEPLLDDLGVDESTLLLILGMITVCVLAPLVEEFFFRGFFYRAVRNWGGIAGAAVATGIVFSLLHAASSPWEHLLPLAVLGAAFCLLYQWTGSLYPCIVLHAINNAIAFSYAQDWTWQYGPMVVGAVALSLGIAVGVSRVWTARPVT